MANQTIRKSAKTSDWKPEANMPEQIQSPADLPLSGYTTFDRKAEEMKIFLSLNPIPQEFLKKK